MQVALLQYAYVYFRRQQGSPLLFPINNRHLVHYYADIIIFMLTSVHGNYLPHFVMGRVCIPVNLLIDQNNILYLLLHEIICLDDGNFLIGMCQYVPE